MTGKLKRNDLSDTLADASSVLLLAPSMSADEDGVCTELLRPEDAASENMMLVSYTKSPDDQLERWREHGHGKPANLGIISVEESTRSVSAASGGTDAGPSLPGGPVETVTNPNDLTGLGINITELLHDWEDNGNRTVVCFDSLTAMLQYVELETAYEFLHVITGRFYRNDAVAHFHMDPGAHDDQTVQSIVSLMDAVVDLREDGTHVRAR